MSMKVELSKGGVWKKRGKVVGEVVKARLIGDNGEVRLEGDWGVGDNGKVEIKSRSKNARLSNFSRIGKDGMQWNGIYCRGLEGFLQGVKFENREMQEECCSLVGAKAWMFGRNKAPDWKVKQVVYWKGNPMERGGMEYEVLLEEFFDSVYKGMEVNRDKLLLSGDLVLAHSSGAKEKKDSILSEGEFIGNLVRIRNELFRELNVEVIWVEGEAPLVSESPKVEKEVIKKKRKKVEKDEDRRKLGSDWYVRREGVWVKE